MDHHEPAGDPVDPAPDPASLDAFTDIGIVETRRAIEAILLVSTDPTPASVLAQVLEVQVEHVELLCHALADSYAEANHGFQLVKVAGGWRYQTHPDMAPYVERYAMDGMSTKLSNAALETLAIVAYKQPISRAQVSAIRGVNVDGVLRTLVQRGYVDEIGRDTGAGQAVLFGTTPLFLERLGVNSVSELPALGDFVPSADVVEALEQTLKVNLEPFPDVEPAEPGAAGSSDPGEPDDVPSPADGEPVEPGADGAATSDGAEVTIDPPEDLAGVEPVEPDAPEAADPASDDGADEPEVADPAPDDGAGTDSTTDSPTDTPSDDSGSTGGESPADHAGGGMTPDESAPPLEPAPEGVIDDAEASPKSGAERPRDPSGEAPEPAEPSGEADGAVAPVDGGTNGLGFPSGPQLGRLPTPAGRFTSHDPSTDPSAHREPTDGPSTGGEPARDEATAWPRGGHLAGEPNAEEPEHQQPEQAEPNGSGLAEEATADTGPFETGPTGGTGPNADAPGPRSGPAEPGGGAADEPQREGSGTAAGPDRLDTADRNGVAPMGRPVTDAGPE